MWHFGCDILLIRIFLHLFRVSQIHIMLEMNEIAISYEMFKSEKTLQMYPLQQVEKNGC